MNEWLTAHTHRHQSPRTSAQKHNDFFSPSPVQAFAKSFRVLIVHWRNETSLLWYVTLELLRGCFARFIFCLLLFCVYARSSICSWGSYGLRSSRLSDEHSALHCSIIPSTANHHKVLSSCWLSAIPPRCSFAFPDFLLGCCIPCTLFM